MITKAMTSLEVKNAISSAFQHLEISEYDLLQSDRGGRLTLTKYQSPDGATLAEGIIKRKAVHSSKISRGNICKCLVNICAFYSVLLSASIYHKAYVRV